MFERAVEFYGEENMDEKLFVSFARFEEQCKEVLLRAFQLIVVTFDVLAVLHYIVLLCVMPCIN